MDSMETFIFTSQGAPTFLWGGIILFLPLYFLPYIIAVSRGHNNSVAIFWLTMFSGWSVFGWVGAYIWSFTNSRQDHMNSSKEDIAGQIKKLHQLKEDGILTEGEFSIKKKSLLK